LREKRDKKVWESSIAKIGEAATSGENLMPHIIHAVESYATVGEIADAMRKVFGEYRETVVL
jgi:methylmalonyl-CoA mutase N-terminal domain/subunit